MSSVLKPARVPVPKMPKAAAAKPTSQKQKFYVDFSKPKGDGVFDGDVFLTYFRENLKVENKKRNLGDAVKIELEDNKLVLLPSQKHHVSKRYVKYLTKKFLKKIQLKDFIRVIAASKDGYELRFYNLSRDDDEEEEE